MQEEQQCVASTYLGKGIRRGQGSAVEEIASVAAVGTPLGTPATAAGWDRVGV